MTDLMVQTPVAQAVEAALATGDLGKLTTEQRIRFEAKIDKRVLGCWEWTGAKTSAGYGQFQTGKYSTTGNPLPEYAHRIAYELYVGPIGPGLTIDHLCRNRACVRPDHLEPVSVRENLMRGEGISARYARSDYCSRGHLKSPDNLYVYPNGSHECRECRRIRWQEFAAKRRERSK
jgi:hypothetical protein